MQFRFRTLASAFRATALLAFVLTSSWATCRVLIADEADPPKRVQEVVAAAGGEEKLLKLFRFSERVLITATATPLKPDDKSNRTSVVEVGNRWWVGATPRDKDKVRVLCWAWSLRILLDPKSKVASIDDSQIGDQPAFGLRVTESVKDPIDLYFDKKDQRLLAIEYTDTRHVFSEWKKTDAGHIYPTHVAGFRFADRAARTVNEKQWYQTDILELTPLKELPTELTK
ncbi:MAG: hypothetical protein ACKV2Q_25210 [Planctomycetaceae bacterium]